MEKPLIKPSLGISQIINMSMGFLGIQMGFALQNGNASRILQTFGADVEHLSLFWLAAPLTGMIVQPIVGHYSDRTWNGLGRRRPYILGGAIFTAIAIVLMPNAAMLTLVLPPLLIGAGMLMIMDASINVTMEPFRALIADNLPSEQRSLGFSVQTFLIGIGAVVGSWLPYVLAEYFDVSKVAESGRVPDNVIFSFYVGAVVLIASILWTVMTTKEYAPKELASFENCSGRDEEDRSFGFMRGLLYSIKHMPIAMRQLGLVQFFSWFALFLMWVFTTPAIAEHIYGVTAGDTTSIAYADAGNWVGILFGVYNAFSALYALCLPRIAKLLGQKRTHALSLIIGGIALLAIYFIKDPNVLLVSMIGVGIAWGSILAMPYAILSDTIPSHKMGLYMGLFNFFITFPQIVSGVTGGLLMRYVFQGQAIFALVMAGLLMFCAAWSVVRIKP